MELVIKMPEEIRLALINNIQLSIDQQSICDSYINQAIINGSPLPKGHRDLKDNDILDTIFLNATNSPNKKLSYEEISNLILDADTIIKADLESEEK